MRNVSSTWVGLLGIFVAASCDVPPEEMTLQESNSQTGTTNLVQEGDLETVSANLISEDLEDDVSSFAASPVKNVKTSFSENPSGYRARIEYTGRADNKKVRVDTYVSAFSDTIVSFYYRDGKQVMIASTPFGSPNDTITDVIDSDGRKHLALAQEFDSVAIRKAIASLDKKVKKMLSGSNTLSSRGVGACIVCGGLRYGLGGLVIGAGATCCLAGAGVSCFFCATVAGAAAIAITDAVTCGDYC